MTNLSKSKCVPGADAGKRIQEFGGGRLKTSFSGLSFNLFMI